MVSARETTRLRFEAAVLRWLAGERATPPTAASYDLPNGEDHEVRGRMEVQVRAAAKRLGYRLGGA